MSKTYVKKWKILYCSINEEPRTRFKLLRGFPCPRISVRGRGFASPNDVTSERSQNQPTTLSFPVHFQHFFQNMEIFRTSLALSFWKVSTYFWKKRFCDKKGKTSWTIRCNFHHFLLFFFLSLLDCQKSALISANDKSARIKAHKNGHKEMAKKFKTFMLN